MTCCRGILGVCFLLGLFLFQPGCQNGPAEDKQDGEKKQQRSAQTGDQLGNEDSGEESDPIEPNEPIPYEKKKDDSAGEIPAVKMTAQGRKTCLVFQDDPFPTGTLVTLEGKSVELESLLGEKLTLIAFWTRGQNQFAEMAAVSLLEDLQQDVYAVTRRPDVAVLAINEGDTAESIRQTVQKAEAEYPVLQDTKGTLFKKIATSFLPRIYAIGPKGKILWMDIEYSEATRDELQSVLKAVVGDLETP